MFLYCLLTDAAQFYGRFYQGTPEAGLLATFWRENNGNKDEVFGYSVEGCLPLFTEATFLDNRKYSVLVYMTLDTPDCNSQVMKLYT